MKTINTIQFLKTDIKSEEKNIGRRKKHQLIIGLVFRLYRVDSA